MSTSLGSLVGRLHGAVRRLRVSETGQGLVEYALIIAIVSLGAIASLTFLKGSITGLFSKAGSSINLVEAGSGGTGTGTGTGGSNGPPPANGTPVTPANTATQSGIPATTGGSTQNDIPVYLSSLTGGPAGFTGPGVIYGDEADNPPLNFPVTVTQLGEAKTVPGCQFTTSAGFTFTGVWLREPSNSVGGDWSYNGWTYDWACVSTPAFTPTGGTTFASNFTGPANATTLTGVNASNSHSNDRWFNADTNTNAPANTNANGVYDNNGNSGAPWYYYGGAAQVWLCEWYGTSSYSFSGGHTGQDNGCLGTSPPLPPSGGSVAISNQGGGNSSGYDDGDTLRATTSGWNAHGSPITSYSYRWERSDSFFLGGTCSNSALGTVQGPTSTASTTNDYLTPSQGSGTGDSIWVTVTATNGNGTSTSVTDCVVVDN